MTTSGNIQFTYSCFSPYLSIQQRLGKHSVGLILKYTEQRPNLTQLDPVVEPGIENGGFILKGNPNLTTNKVYSSRYATHLPRSGRFPWMVLSTGMKRIGMPPTKFDTKP